MRRFFIFILRFIAGVERDVPAEASAVVQRVVHNYDNFVVNVYSAISVDCKNEYCDLWNCKSLKEYIEAGRLYRHAESTFAPVIGEITNALSAAAHETYGSDNAII